MVLPIDPAGVKTGTSTSGRCSAAEPQGMDWTKACGADPRMAPSMLMACEGAASRRDTVTLTWEDGELPGQSIFNANSVEITNDPEFLRLRSPGANGPFTQKNPPKYRR